MNTSKVDMYKFQLCFCICFFHFAFIDGQTCDDKCFVDVGEALNHVRNKLKRESEINVTPPYANIKQLLNRLNSIDPNIKRLENVSYLINIINNNILNSWITLGGVANGINLISLMKIKLQHLKYLKRNHDDAIRKCKDAEIDYTSLRNTLNEIGITGRRLADQVDINFNKYKSVLKAGLDIKNAFDKLTIDDSAFTGYLCNPILQATIQGIIDILKNIENVFKNLSKRLMEKLTSARHENRKIIDYIVSLNKSIPETDIRITNETENLIESLRKQLKELGNKIKDIKFEVLKKIKQNNDILLNDFETIFKFLLSESNIKKAREELQRTRDILTIFEDKEEVSKELQRVERIATDLYRSKVCYVIENIELEDKTIIKN